MASKKWCIGLAAFRDIPGGTRIQDIPPGALIEATGRQEAGKVKGHSVTWSEIWYRGKTAWINDSYLEDYAEKYEKDEVFIGHPTPDPNDAAQYMLLDGRVKYNMCGELCAAFIGGDDIDTFLTKWAAISPNYYKWALYGDSDNPTGIDALESMLKVYGYEFPMLRWEAGLTDPVIGLKVTPRRMQRMLEAYYLIAGVRIDSITGKLRGQGLGHWVVLDKIEAYGVNGGWVQVYNPFRNRRQDYSYDEFLSSAASYRTGIWVKRPVK